MEKKKTTVRKKTTSGKKTSSRKQVRKERPMRSSKAPVVIVILLMILLIFAGIASHLISKYTPTKKLADLYEYYGQPQDEEAAIIVDSVILEERGIREGEVTYLPLSVVNEYLNQRFYYDMETDQILYATPTMLEEYSLAGSKDLVERDGTVYLSLDLIHAHTDFDAFENDAPARVSIHTVPGQTEMIPVKKETRIRLLGGIKSEVLTTVPAGEELYFMEELENWDKVATRDGYIGYTEKKNLGKPKTVEETRDFQEEQYTYLTLDQKVNLVWHQVTNYDANSQLTVDTQEMTGVNVISPTWFAVTDNQGTLFNIASSDYVAEAHSMGLQVWGLIDNFTYDFSTFELLSHRSSRTNVIRQLIDTAAEVGLDGINVDFEMLSEDSGVHFLEFLRELSIECHKHNLILSVDNPVPEDFTSHYDRAEQGRIVDYVIIMGYDEHYAGSEIEGSVASLPWVEKGIQDTIEVVPAERVLNGMPFYMRLWKRSAGILSSEAIGMKQAQESIEANHVDIYWNTDYGQNYGEYEVDGNLYQIWVEDAESIAAKVQLASQYGLGGVAAWKLGFEDSGVWNVITDNLK